MAVISKRCSKPSLQLFSAITAKNVDWLWYPYIPFGKITIVQGDPGDGKTTFILNIAALLSKGLPMPETDRMVPCSNVIYQSAEDSVADTLKPRLVSANADCSKIAFIDESECGLTLADDRVENAIDELNAKLLILDPLQAYLGEGNEMNRVDGIRPTMRRLGMIAERTGCAIVIVGHMNKGSGTKGIYRGLGSIDISAAARSILLVGRIKNTPAIRAMVQIKNSLAAEGLPIAFEIHDKAALRWIGTYDITPDELLGSDDQSNAGDKQPIAITRLNELLLNQTVPCTKVYEILQKEGISKRTVDRAKKALGVKSAKRSDGWYWTLCEEAEI